MPKKVLMFGWEFPPMITGGLGTACYGITKGLSENGVSVTFVMPHESGSVHDHVNMINSSNIGVNFDNIDIIEIDSPLSPYESPEQYLEIINSLSYKKFLSGKERSSAMYGEDIFKEVRRYAKAAKAISLSNDFDVIHCHDWMTAQAGIEAKKATGKPLIMHVHATEIDRTLGSPDNRIYNIEKEGMLLADKIIAVSQWTKQTILKHYPINPDKIIVIYNAIEQLKNPVNFRSKILKKDSIVLFLGRMTSMKGPEYFLKAAEKALKINKYIKFVMGGTGDQLKRMIDYSAQLGIAKNVMFLGFFNPQTVDQICSTANLFIMPSVSEPFGIVPLEAVRNRVPVIISKSSGVSEILPNSLKVDFWDTDEIANKILAVLKYKPLHTQLRNLALDDIKDLTWNKQAEKISGVYNGLNK